MITDAHLVLVAVGSIYLAVAVYGYWLYRLQRRLQ